MTSDQYYGFSSRSVLCLGDPVLFWRNELQKGIAHQGTRSNRICGASRPVPESHPFSSRYQESELKVFCSKNILSILGFSCIIAVIALLALGLTQNKALPENVKFGIVLDAGSSHTSLYIYRWPAEKENDTGVVTQIEECKLKGPGISSFAKKLNEINVYLTACMERARKVIPSIQHTETPVYLGATAGMRLLRMENKQMADKILAVVASSISKYPFDFQGARIISGQEEGAYGWITVNYLLGKFTQKLSWFNLKPSKDDTQETYGALDLGGASTQITFVPRNETTESPDNNLYFRLYGKNYNVYTHSFLCYGKDQALFQKLALGLQGTNGIIREPCFHSGYRRKVKMSVFNEGFCTMRYELNSSFYPLSDVDIRGTGRFRQCQQSIIQLFNTSYCPYSSCSFNGVFLPPLQGQFGAFSAFYYVMEFLNFTSQESTSVEKLTEKLQEFCAQRWEEVEKNFGDVKEKYLSEYCFSGTYILVLLLNGYHFTAESWKNIHFMNKVRSTSVGWTLGYMLNLTNKIPAEQPLSAPLPHSTYVFLMVLFSLILLAVIIVGIVVFHKPSYLWKDVRMCLIGNELFDENVCRKNACGRGVNGKDTYGEVLNVEENRNIIESLRGKVREKLKNAKINQGEKSSTQLLIDNKIYQWSKNFAEGQDEDFVEEVIFPDLLEVKAADYKDDQEQIKKQQANIFVPSSSPVKSDLESSIRNRMEGQREMYQLDLNIVGLQFSHHPLFNQEQVLCARLLQLYECFQDRQQQNLPQLLYEKLKALTDATRLANENSEISQLTRESLQDYYWQISDTKQLYELEKEKDFSLLHSILRTWKQIKSLRQRQGFTSTSVKLQFQRLKMNKCDEQKQELSKMSGTEKKTEGKAFKNRKKQEVYEISKRTCLLAKLYLPLPNSTELKSKTILEYLEFSSDKLVIPAYGEVGSNVPFLLEENGTEELCLLTSGKLSYSLSWALDEKGVPLTPLSQSLRSAFCRNVDARGVPEIPWLINAQKLFEWANEVRIDPNNPECSDLMEFITYIKHKGQDIPKYFRLEQLQDEFNFASEEEMKKSKRFQLLQLRNAGQLDVFLLQQMPLYDTEIPDLVFQMRRLVMRRIVKVSKFNLSDIVADYEEIISASQLTYAVCKLLEQRRKLKPQRKERKKVAAQTICDRDIKILIRILRAYNIPTRRTTVNRIHSVHILFQISGTFQVNIPPFLLGYTWSKTYVSPKEDYNGQNLKECTFLNIFATIEPQISYAICSPALDKDLVAHFVSLIPIMPDALDENDGFDIWMTSERCISLAIGNKEEHAILLCNFFLYFGKKALVLLGTSVLEGPVAYVLTQETDEYLLWNPLTGQCHKQFDPFCPLQGVDCLFDGENVWFNLQQNNSPMSVYFDYSKESFWKQLLPKNYQGTKTQSIQPEEIIYSDTNKSMVEDLKNRIERTLKCKIMEWRPKQPTRWNRQCTFILRQILPKLELGTGSFVSSEEESEFERLLQFYWVTGFPIQMPYTDVQSVIDAVYQTGIHSSEFPQTEFALAVYIHPYPNNILSVWVYLASLARHQ
ncbi:hypothetical protein MG293_019525 [Ovis ammon polii]|uniref:apyrase n=1 Tax=Ovis ammon polii TaxID=230172 RepID=A0AAD4Y241_OVIAM|nr:hypothetical protein MG293_019525 [Ovis ammon polii]